MQRTVPERAEARVAKEIWNANASDLETRLSERESVLIRDDVPPASVTVEGITELATQAEVNSGVDTTRIVTPATLSPRLDTKQPRGEKNQALGYLGLSSAGVADPTKLGTGGGGGKFLRDDGTYQTVPVTSLPDASASTKGIVLLDKNPVTPTSPIVLGRNSSIWETYIEGLNLGWTSPGTNASNISVTSGSAWIPGLNRMLDVPNPISALAMPLSANTLYFAYLYDDAGTPKFYLDPTVPAAPYKGSASHFPGWPTFRYIGAVRSNSSARIMAFQMSRDGDVFYKENINHDISPFGLFTNAFTPPTEFVTRLGIDGLNMVPPSCRLAWINFVISSGVTYVQTPDDAMQNINSEGRVVQGVPGTLREIPLSNDQQFIVNGGSIYAYLCGYRDQR